MVDKIKPLKIEDTTSGTEFDMVPTETNPSEDYVAAKGVAFENSDDTTIRGDSGVMKFQDSDVTTEVTLEDLLSGGDGASPGFSFGREGSSAAGTWLRRPGNIESNRTGIPIMVTDPVISRIACGTENVSNYDVTIYEHDGNSINLTTLTTVSVTTSDGRFKIFDVSVSATEGKQLAVRVTANSSGNPTNLGVDIVIKGTV